MTKREKEQAIHKAIKDGRRLTDQQVRFAGKHGICIWGSVNYEEHEAKVKASAEYQRISRMGSVVDSFNHEAYQRMIYSNGWNR